MEVYVLVRTSDGNEPFGVYSSLDKAMDGVPDAVWFEDGSVGLVESDGRTTYYRIEKHTVDA